MNRSCGTVVPDGRGPDRQTMVPARADLPATAALLGGRCRIRPLPCESAKGSRQTYTSLVKSSQSLDTATSPNSDVRHDLAPFFTRLGPNWVQCLSSKH